MNGSFLVRMIRSVLESEQLEVSPEPERGKTRQSFAYRLLSAEDLPLDDPAPQGAERDPGLRLFASEYLPADASVEPTSRRPSFLAWLFSGETLPVDPVRTDRSSGAGR